MSRTTVLHAHNPYRADLSLCGVYDITNFANEPDDVTCKRCQKRLATEPDPT